MSLRNHIEALRDVMQSGLSASKRSDDARRHEIIKRRKEAAAMIATVSKASESDAFLNANPALATEFRTRLSALRSAMAKHQSKWSVAILDGNTPAYNESVANMTHHQNELIDWSLQNLKG